MTLRALVGEVWPFRLGELEFGSDLVVHVVRGNLAAGDLVDVQVGVGRTRSARVESVAATDPAAPFVKERIALPGHPPALGARLDVRVSEIPPSEIVLMGTVVTSAAPTNGTPAPVCPWAAVFDTLQRFEDGLALVSLFEEDAAQLANGEPPDYFLGCLASERAIAAVVSDRMRALFGGGDHEWTPAGFLRTTRGPIEPTTEERDGFVERLRAAGVTLSVPD